MNRYITEVVIVFQREARPREKKDVVGFREAGVKYKNKKIEYPTNFPVGPGTGGNERLRRIIARAVMKFRPKDAEFYYVTVKEGRDILNVNTGEIESVSIFRTIMPRTTIPEISIRHL